jgi:hypothetical protein
MRPRPAGFTRPPRRLRRAMARPAPAAAPSQAAAAVAPTASCSCRARAPRARARPHLCTRLTRSRPPPPPALIARYQPPSLRARARLPPPPPLQPRSPFPIPPLPAALAAAAVPPDPTALPHRHWPRSLLRWRPFPCPATDRAARAPLGRAAARQTATRGLQLSRGAQRPLRYEAAQGLHGPRAASWARTCSAHLLRPDHCCAQSPRPVCALPRRALLTPPVHLRRGPTLQLPPCAHRRPSTFPAGSRCPSSTSPCSRRRSQSSPPERPRPSPSRGAGPGMRPGWPACSPKSHLAPRGRRRAISPKSHLAPRGRRRAISPKSNLAPRGRRAAAVLAGPAQVRCVGPG